MAKKKIKQPVELAPVAIAAPIKWIIPDNLITRFATNMLVQSIEDKEFKISFFETKPPIIFGPSDPRPTEILAECVASVVITAERMPKFVEALEKHLGKRQALIKAKTKQS